MNNTSAEKQREYFETFPEAGQCQIWIDFDGTITKKDTLDELIFKYSIDDSWKLIEKRWQAGLIGSRQCLEEEFALLRIPKAELHKSIENIEVDDGIFNLLKIIKTYSIPITIVSDGVDLFINQILKNNNIHGITIRSNTIEHNEPYLKLICPYNNTNCPVGSAHCKCLSMDTLTAANKKSIYIGDGLSDLCAAKHSDFIFAKGALAKNLTTEGKLFFEFKDLTQIADFIIEKWEI
ncbi:MAG: MtnX-like HAD-IB family phosphatase [Spirochaetes bacterium]|nr:MtnX-like HAD-IB family phosphatase [Spirochaetota bacterium]